MSQTVQLDAGPGTVAAEVDVPGGRQQGPRFLLAHGAGGDRNTPGLRALAGVLAEQGFLVVRPDLAYRAAGRASPPRAERSVDSFAATVRAAQDRWGYERPWVVGGRSYGGRVASMAVAQGLPACGLLLYSYPLHRPGDPSQPRVAHWPEIRVPCLFLEGTEDPFCDLEVFRRHLPHLGGPPTVHLVQGADHSLRITRKRSPDGKARSEAAVVAGLAPVVREWAMEVA